MSEKLEMPLEQFVTAVCKENERLRDILHHGGIVEIAAHNNRVTEYMFHWEGRALDAEAEVERLKKALEDIADGMGEDVDDLVSIGRFAPSVARAALRKT